MAQAYDYLAEWFETLNDDCDYPKWSQYFIDGLARLGARQRGLELGCGSGAFSRALAKAGYQMTGADISRPMLSRAVELARREGVFVEYLYSDAATVKTNSRFDFIISPNDCYNYIPPDKLASAFRHAADCLKKDGIFWFDLSSKHKLCDIIANNIFCDDRDEVTYLSFNSLKEDRVETDVTLFIRGREGTYVRRDEHHTQYIHGEEEVLSALRERFEVLSVEGHLGGGVEGSERLNFICRRK